MRATSGRHWLIAAALGLTIGALHAWVTLRRFSRFESMSFDNAIFEQAIKGYARDGVPTVDIKGPGFNVLGDHFSPITALVAPFYRMAPSAQTILLAQVVLISISIVIVAALAMRHLGTVVGCVIGILYGLSFGLQSAVEADFHEVAFGAPLLALAGAAYVDRRHAAVVLWSLPLLLVKEDLGLTVAVIGGVLWWAGERRRAVLLGAVGIAAMALIILAIVPAFSADGSYAYFGRVGGEGGTFATIFDEPGRKAATVLLTVGVTGLAALFSPWVLVLLPTFAWRFVGDTPFYWGTEFHYSLLPMTIVFVAMVDAMVRRPVLKWVTPIAVVVSGFLMVSSPIASAFEDDPAPARVATAREVVSLVPDGVTVESDMALISHLVTDRTVYWIGTVGDAIPEYVLFDQWTRIGSPPDIVGYAEETHGGSYEVVFERDGYVLARRR